MQKEETDVLKENREQYKAMLKCKNKNFPVQVN